MSYLTGAASTPTGASLIFDACMITCPTCLTLSLAVIFSSRQSAVLLTLTAHRTAIRTAALLLGPSLLRLHPVWKKRILLKFQSSSIFLPLDTYPHAIGHPGTY